MKKAAHFMAAEKQSTDHQCQRERTRYKPQCHDSCHPPSCTQKCVLLIPSVALKPVKLTVQFNLSTGSESPHPICVTLAIVLHIFGSCDLSFLSEHEKFLSCKSKIWFYFLRIGLFLEKCSSSLYHLELPFV